jgi:hypothetical protein
MGRLRRPGAKPPVIIFRRNYINNISLVYIEYIRTCTEPIYKTKPQLIDGGQRIRKDYMH